MKHTPSAVAVFQSSDYDRFRLITGNRSLNLQKIKKIIADIETGTNLLRYNPLLVVVKDGHLDIVDGQHRFAVCKKLKEPVHYIIAEDLTLYQIAKMNSNTEKWKSEDFINCYKELKNPGYIKLDMLLKKYKSSPVICVASLLHNGTVQVTGHEGVTEIFKQGLLEAKHEDRAELLLSTAASVNFSRNMTRDFLCALQRIIDAGVIEIGVLIEKVNANADELIPQTNTKRYIANLEEIANKGKHKRVLIC